MVVVVAVGVQMEVADRHTVPCWVHIALVGVVAVAAVEAVEAETGVIETAATNDTRTVHCSVHTALVPVQVDIRPYKDSRTAESFGARSSLVVHIQALKAEHNIQLAEVAALYLVLASRYAG